MKVNPQSKSIFLILLLLMLYFGMGRYALPDEIQDVEDRLFRNQTEDLKKRLIKAKDIKIEPANVVINENEKEQLYYCSRLVQSARSGANELRTPSPIISTATHGNNYIHALMQRQSKYCERIDSVSKIFSELITSEGHSTFIRIYSNPEVSNGQIFMRILNNSRKKQKTASQAVVMHYLVDIGNEEHGTCPAYQDTGISPSMQGVLQFDEKIMFYALGQTKLPCPDEHVCRSDLNDNRKYYLRIYPNNMGIEVFGAAYVRAVENDEEIFESWNKNYICTIYFN